MFQLVMEQQKGILIMVASIKSIKDQQKVSKTNSKNQHPTNFKNKGIMITQTSTFICHHQKQNRNNPKQSEVILTQKFLELFLYYMSRIMLFHYYIILSLNMLQSRNKRSSRDSENRVDPFGGHFGFGGLDNQIMKHFGMGFSNDFFDIGSFSDPFEQIQSFSKLHKKAHQSKNQGAFYCQTFVQSSKMGDNGQIVTEKYYDKNYGQNKGGNTISQKQQAYKNSQGVNKLAEQRMFNDKGRKVVKTKLANGQIQQNNHYYNIDPDYDFDGEWNNYNRQIGFLDNIHKITSGNRNDNRMALEYDQNPNNYRGKKMDRTKDYDNNHMIGSSQIKAPANRNRLSYGRSVGRPLPITGESNNFEGRKSKYDKTNKSYQRPYDRDNDEEGKNEQRKANNRTNDDFKGSKRWNNSDFNNNRNSNFGTDSKRSKNYY